MICEISAGSRVFDRSRRSLFRLRLNGGESREVTFRASGSVTSGSTAGFTSWGRTIAVGVISEKTGGTRFWSEKADELSCVTLDAVSTEEDEVMEEELPRVELGGGFLGGKLVISAPG